MPVNKFVATCRATQRANKILLGALITATLAGCGGLSKRTPESEREVSAAPSAAQSPASTMPRRGGYYQDDGPGDNPPANLGAILDAIPDAQPGSETPHRFANKPYSVLGRDYVPDTALKPYTARGVASWYGKKFHGSRTSSGERYDMYAMTAAHPTLQIPSYARVTNLANGRSVVVRINDRGPFHANRIIDLSYAAAHKLGYIGQGSAQVEVESILPGTPRMEFALKAAPKIAGPLASAAAEDGSSKPPAFPARADARGLYLQLGAFANSDNAESFRVRLYQQLAWLNEAIHIIAGEGAFRLHLGPYRDAAEASRIAQRISESLEIKPLLIQR